MSVVNRLQKLKSRIHDVCAHAGRDPSSVRLLAVSKLQSPDSVREAFACGQRDFAENYLQEALEKQESLADLHELRWHFIGRIQSNKVRALANRFAVIHSVERVSVVEALSRATRGVQDIYLQFNVAGETSKGGAADERALEDLLTAAKKCANLRVLGLMVMPPLDATVEQSRGYFRCAREVASRFGLQELSMGTSHDFAEAIAEGATWIRIGTDVFGPRPTREG